MEKPTYTFKIKSRDNGKPIRHYMNNDDFGYYAEQSEETDKAMCHMALGIVMALSHEQQTFVEVWKLNEKGYYDLYYTRF